MNNTLARSSREELQHYVSCKNWDRVIKLCQHMLLENPQQADLYDLQGRAFARLNNYPSAIESYHQALGLSPNQPQGHYTLATLYTRQKHYVQAVAHFQMALGLKPHWPEAA